MNRFPRWTTFGLLCAVSMLVVQLATARTQPLRPGRPGAVPSAIGTNITYLPQVSTAYDPNYVNPFGVDIYGDVTDANGLAAMRAAGARRVTTVFNWITAEPSEGVYNWTTFDTSVRNARAAGMELFVLFHGDPQWAWLPDRSATISEKRLNFVRTMVDRYDCDGVNDAGPNMCVRYWSFYMEPDAYYNYSSVQTSPGTKGYWGKRGKEYARMLAGVANVIHAEDPQAKVLIGGLAYDWFTTEGGPFVQSFLADVLAELNANYGGARKTIDEVAVHYYPISFTSLRQKLEVGRPGIPGIRTILQTYGVGDIPISVPETGYWSDPAQNSSEEKQAAWLVRLYVQALAIGVKHLGWYDVFDGGPGTQSWGLFRGKDLNSPKPAYYAYQTMTRELTGAYFARTSISGSIEQHVFRTPRGTEKTVIWTNAATGQAAIPLPCLRIVQINGVVASPVRDGDATWDQDKTVNGRITLGLTANRPLYYEAC